MRNERADERTRPAFLLITSDNSGVAGCCSMLRKAIIEADSFAGGCPLFPHVARSVVSRWCQSASGRPLITSWQQLGSNLGNEELMRRLEAVYTQAQKK